MRLRIGHSSLLSHCNSRATGLRRRAAHCTLMSGLAAALFGFVRSARRRAADGRTVAILVAAGGTILTTAELGKSRH